MSYLKDNKDIFNNAIRELESSWKSERYSHVRRPYEPEHIASKRSTLRSTFPAQLTSKKLWELLNKYKENKAGSLTFDCGDAKQTLAMVKNFDTLYVSNLQGAIQSSLNPNPNIPIEGYNANLVQQIHKLQDWSDRRQQEYRYMQKSDKSKSDAPLPDRIDFYTPVIADADCANGNVARTMRYTKNLIESGASAIQIEDCEHGLLANQFLPVLMPLSDHINRLVSIRAQSDIMNVDTIIISKNCGLGTQFITSVNDIRDHPFIIGATVPGPALAEIIKIEKNRGVSNDELITIMNTWFNQTQCIPYREAIAQAIKTTSGGKDVDKMISEWMMETSNLSLEKVQELAKAKGFQNVYWDCNLCRSIEGFFAYNPTLDGIKSRALHVAPYCDVVSLKTNKVIPPFELMKEFADFSKREIPKNLIGYNYPPLIDFNVVSNGLSDEIIEQCEKLGKEGFVFQTLCLNNPQSFVVAQDLHCQQQYQKELFSFAEQLRQKIQSPIIPTQAEDKGYSDYANKLLGVLNSTIYQSGQPLMSAPQSQQHQMNEKSKPIGSWVKDKLGFGQENKNESQDKNYQSANAPVYAGNSPSGFEGMVVNPINTFPRGMPTTSRGGRSSLIDLSSPLNSQKSLNSFNQ